MKRLKTSLIGVFVLLCLLSAVYDNVVNSQGKKAPPTGQANVALSDDDIQRNCRIDTEATICNFCPRPREAPTGFDDQTNGFIDQNTHTQNRITFEVRDEILPDANGNGGGLGPVYNAQSCAECHQNPVSGSVSQITELRAGHFGVPANCPTCLPRFDDPPGGSLINHRAVDMRVDPYLAVANIQERVPPLFSAGITEQENVRTNRTSLNLLGDGFVEAISNQTLLNLVQQETAESNEVHPVAIRVPVEEVRDGRCRIGRFGHKDQHASLLSFSGDAYINEIGITNRLFLMENTSLGRSVANFDFVPDNRPCDNDPHVICGEDIENDIDAFTDFMRSAKAPPRDAVIAATRDAGAGEELFKKIGCAVCHRDSITTAPAGTVINLGQFTVPPELGNKIIHPYGDFLLHDIGTGDGIVQNGGQDTRLLVRTAPLWGVRTHVGLMHDGVSLTFEEAIDRHHVEAQTPRDKFFTSLSQQQREQIIIFLESL
ncbi:MAG: di-heme oxidoredictase family protein [Pyrinomonadaceae bacterium]